MRHSFSAGRGGYLGSAALVLGVWLLPGPASGPAHAAVAGQVAAPAAIVDIPVPSVVDAVAVDTATDTAYVAEESAPTGTVAVVSLKTDAITATIPVGLHPSSIAVNETTNTIYVVNYHDSTVSVIDGVTKSVTHTIPVSQHANAINGIAVDPATNMIYVGVRHESVAVIDGTTNAVTGTIAGGGSAFPIGIAVDSATDTIYGAFGAFLPYSLLVIDGHTNSLTKTVPLPSTPNAIAVDPPAKTFYIANYGETITAYNEETDSAIGTISLGAEPLDLALNPSADTLYAAETSSAAPGVVLVNTATKQVTRPIGVPFANHLAADPATGTLVVLGYKDIAVVTLRAPTLPGTTKATFRVGVAGSFNVGATGTPAPVVTSAAPVPAGLTLSSAGVLAGTPANGTAGIHHLALTAANDIAPAASQTLTLTIDQAPAFSSANHATFKAGVKGTLTVRCTGFPAPTLTMTGRLPSGVRFAARSNGTATISGTPGKSARGKKFVIKITATNHIGKAATQTFTLRVS